MNSYKDRILNPDLPVEVYRCLKRKGRVFSIRQNGLVVAHTSSVILKDCEFIVNQAGSNRVKNTKERFVHAWIKGYVGNSNDIPLSFGFIVNYNPYKDNQFRAKILGISFNVFKSRAVHIKNNDNVYYY